MSRGALLLLLVAFAAAGAIGFVIGTGGDPGTAEDAPTGSTRPRQEPRPPDPAGTSPRGPDLARALSRLPVPDAAWGTGRIPVLVRTEEGAPLPGVLVRAVPVRERFEDPVRSGRLPDDPPVEDLVERLVAQTLRARAERIEAVTGEDGAC